MLKDKKLKQEILKSLMSSMDENIAENDLKPKTKMVIKATGDSPEDVKEEVINKLQGMNLPDENENEEKMGMPKMEGCPMEDEEMEDDYLSEMPTALKEALMKKLKK